MKNERKASAVPEAAGPGDPPVLTAKQLRRLAEAADGARGEDLVLVYGSQSGEPESYQMVPQGKLPTMQSKRELLTIKTERKRQPKSTKYQRGDVDAVEITFGQHVKRFDLAEKYDAVFWSESAVEKFLFEYYLPLKEKEEWDLMYELYMNPPAGALPVFAIAHEYPTVDTQLYDVPTVVLTPEGPMSIRDYVSANRQFLPG